MSKPQTEIEHKVRINTIIRGEPAEWLKDWKRRGLVRSNSDALRQAFRCFQQSLIEARLRTSESAEDPSSRELSPRRRY